MSIIRKVFMGSLLLRILAVVALCFGIAILVSIASLIGGNAGQGEGMASMGRGLAIAAVSLYGLIGLPVMTLLLFGAIYAAARNEESVRKSCFASGVLICIGLVADATALAWVAINAETRHQQDSVAIREAETAQGIREASVPVVSEQARIVAEIKQLGGTVTVDETSPDRPVIGVVLAETHLNDNNTVLEHLRSLTNLQSLDLQGTPVTDAALAHLKGLTKLQTLNLRHIQWLTDAGLDHLQGLSQLKDLDLRDTWVTDAGLERLKALGNLQRLDLRGTRRVTDVGVKRLQQILPSCSVTVH